MINISHYIIIWFMYLFKYIEVIGRWTSNLHAQRLGHRALDLYDPRFWWNMGTRANRLKCIYPDWELIHIQTYYNVFRSTSANEADLHFSKEATSWKCVRKKNLKKNTKCAEKNAEKKKRFRRKAPNTWEGFRSFIRRWKSRPAGSKDLYF